MLTVAASVVSYMRWHPEVPPPTPTPMGEYKGTRSIGQELEAYRNMGFKCVFWYKETRQNKHLDKTYQIAEYMTKYDEFNTYECIKEGFPGHEFVLAEDIRNGNLIGERHNFYPPYAL